jgi:hypothetical protein
MAVIGSAVTYVDPVGVEHDAIVTARFDGAYNDSAEAINPAMAINVVYVSGDPAETDQYGRQIKRETSVQGEASGVTAHGRFWRE